jgi:hypothetical protein
VTEALSSHISEEEGNDQAAAAPEAAGTPTEPGIRFDPFDERAREEATTVAPPAAVGGDPSSFRCSGAGAIEAGADRCSGAESGRLCVQRASIASTASMNSCASSRDSASYATLDTAIDGDLSGADVSAEASVASSGAATDCRDEVSSFLYRVLEHLGLDVECLVIALILLERAIMQSARLVLSRYTWRLSTLAALVVAAKTWCVDLLLLLLSSQACPSAGSFSHRTPERPRGGDPPLHRSRRRGILAPPPLTPLTPQVCS